MANTLTDLSSVIDTATKKATASEESANEELLIDAQIKAAGERADSATKQLDQANITKEEAESKLAPPPMKTEAGDGKKGGSKKVVDENEKNKLESDVRAAEAQIQQAQAAVDAAKQEASDLTTKKAEFRDTTDTEKQSMTDFTKQLEDLKKMAKDPNTDLTGDEYQKKLQDAVKKADELSKTLPENADTADFWKDTTASFKELDAAMDEYLDIDAPPIDSANNYKGFFDMTNDQFGKMITALQGQGVDQALIVQLQGAQDSITNQSDVYLGGVTEDDKTQMGEMLRQVMVINDNLTKGNAVTNDDIAKLLKIAGENSQMLSQGGSQSGSVNANYFIGIKNNIDYIGGKVNDSGFNDFMDDYSKFFASNNQDDLRGIEVGDMQQISDFNDLVRAAKDKLANGGTLTQAEMDALTTSGQGILDLMVNKYGLADGQGTGAGNDDNLHAKR